MDFKDKTAVVTGGVRGIGLCIAKMLLGECAKVVIADIEPANDRTTEVLAGFEDKYTILQTDISDEAGVIEMAKTAAAYSVRIDVLVNSAAISCNKPIAELSYRDWKRVIDVNLSGTFLCSKHCGRFMTSHGGEIVNIASTRAFMSEPDTEAYSASKAGIVGLTHSLAISLGPKIRVNCISPGWIDTTGYRPAAETETLLSPADHKQHPAGRVGRPQDIANMVLYLCSSKAEFITGQNFTIDGGMTTKMIYV